MLACCLLFAALQSSLQMLQVHELVFTRDNNLGNLAAAETMTLLESHRSREEVTIPIRRAIPILRASRQVNASKGKNVVDGMVVKRHRSCPETASLLMQTTLATQLSIDRFWLLEEICQRWKEPLVAVVYFGPGHPTPDLDFSLSLRDRLLSADCPWDVHLILYVDDENPYDKGDADTSSSSSNRNSRPPYPINLLRNLALEAVRTSFVFMVDVDFLPSVTLADDIRAAWKTRRVAREAWSRQKANENQLDKQTWTREALVVPALEMNLRDHQPAFLENPTQFTHSIPRTWDQLALCIGTNLCTPFHENFHRAHGSTRTDLWLQQEWYHSYNSGNCDGMSANVRDLRRVACVDAPGYEPYTVLPWCYDRADSSDLTPFYDERLAGYGWNK
jgi:hypothetical protein